MFIKINEKKGFDIVPESQVNSEETKSGPVASSSQTQNDQKAQGYVDSFPLQHQIPAATPIYDITSRRAVMPEVEQSIRPIDRLDPKPLSDQRAAEAAQKNQALGYTEDTIREIQRFIGSEETGVFSADDAQLICAFMNAEHIMTEKGVFGREVLVKAGISASYEYSEDAPTHTLGEDTPHWCDQQGYKTSSSLDHSKMDSSFASVVKRVKNAVEDAGGKIDVTCTFRHELRAAVMCYSRYMCDVDKYEGDNLTTKQKKAKATRDTRLEGAKYKFARAGFKIEGTKEGAEKAVRAFGLVTDAPIALDSNHSQGIAVDIKIKNLPKSFMYGTTRVTTTGDGETHTDKASLKANADALSAALRSASVASNFIWYGNGDYVHWSTTGR